MGKGLGDRDLRQRRQCFWLNHGCDSLDWVTKGRDMWKGIKDYFPGTYEMDLTEEALRWDWSAVSRSVNIGCWIGRSW